MMCYFHYEFEASLTRPGLKIPGDAREDCIID